MTDLDRRVLLGIAGAAGVAALSRAAQAGSLNPPAGPVSPSMKPLSDVEPRTAVQSLSGDGSSQFVISQSGSYYLTGNIAAVGATNAIFVTAPYVTIDLNGFALIGAGSAVGILGNNSATDLCVRNGTINGWVIGIEISITAPRARIDNVGVDNCSSGGILVGQRGIVSHCTVTGCGVTGIGAQNGARVVNCVAAAMTGGGDGISVDYGSVIQDCSATENTGNGFVAAGAGVAILGCKATFNSKDGVLLNGPYNEAVDTIATHNSQNGIHAVGANGRIDRCSALQNVGNGIQVDTMNGATIVLRCIANGSLGTDYSIASGNRPAQVASWGSVAGGFGATDAVANVR